MFPTGPSASGSREGGDTVELEKLGSHLEEVCGAVCGNSGARSLLVEKSKRKSSSIHKHPVQFREPRKHVRFSSPKTLLPQAVVVGR